MLLARKNSLEEEEEYNFDSKDLQKLRQEESKSEQHSSSASDGWDMSSEKISSNSEQSPSQRRHTLSVSEKSITANELLANDEQTRDQKLKKISERHIMEEKQILRSLKKESKKKKHPSSQNILHSTSQKYPLKKLTKSVPITPPPA